MSTSAKDFLATLYRGQGWLEIRVLDTRGRIAYFERSVDDALKSFDKWRLIREANIYFGVCPRKGEGKARLNDILCSYSVWIDVDAADEDERTAARKRIKDFPLPPSIVVSSGRGFHVYWLLRKPTKKWDTFSKVIKAFEKMFKADRTGDRTRVLRVPGTMHTKDPNNPLPVSIIEELTDLQRMYSLRDLALAPKLLDPELKLRHKICTGDVRGYPSRSERDWNVITTLIRLGFSDDAIRHIFMVHAVGDRAREEEEYFTRTLKEARESRDPDETPLNLIVKSPSPAVLVSTPSGDDSTSVESEEVDDLEEEVEERDWGFEEGDDGFLYRMNGKEPRMISTFVFDPTRLLKGSVDTEDALMGNIRASGHTWASVTFPRKAFSRSDALHRELRIAAWQWLGGDADTREYLPYLMSLLQAKGLPHTRSVSSLGRHGDVWVSSAGALTATEVFDKTTAPKVYFSKTGSEVKVAYPVPQADELEELKGAVRTLLPKVNRPDAIYGMIGWFFAAAYKPVLRTIGIRFPILNVWGTRGSGKTSTVTDVFHPLMGLVDSVGHDSDTTQFVLLALYGATTSIPVAFAEFRQTGMRSTAYRRFLHCLLQSYDTGRDSRGRPDQTVQQYPLTSPFSVDGEDMVADAAARERIVAVNLSPETIKKGTEAFAAFNELITLKLNELAGAYVQFTLAQDVEELWAKASALFDKAFSESMPNRVRRNYSVVVLGLLSYLRFMEEDLSENKEIQFIQSVLSPSLSTLLNPEGRTSLPVDEFIEDVANAVGLYAANAFFYKYYSKGNRLRFHLTTALRWWYSKRRREGNDALAQSAIKQQLKERQKEYIIAPKGTSVGGSTKWMYGIDVAKALAIGLDIPETLPTEVEVTLSF